MAQLTIEQVSEPTSSATSAIRYDEREGLLQKAPNKDGYRVNDPDTLNCRAVIELAKGAGMTIVQTKRLLGPLDAAGPLAWAPIQY